LPYIDPKDAKSPRENWTLIDVLHNGGPGEHAIAIGEWDGTRCLAMRWNGNDEKPAGNPQSRGNPTWFIIPKEYNEALLEVIPPGKKTLVKALFGDGSEPPVRYT